MSMATGFVARSSEPKAEGAASRFPREQRWRAPEAKAAEAPVSPKFGIDLESLRLYPPGGPRSEASIPWPWQLARPGAAIGVASHEKKREDTAPEMEPAVSRAPTRQPSAARPAGPSASAAFGTTRGVLQAKLAVGSVEDPLEQEADRIADKVLRMPDSAAGRARRRLPRGRLGPRLIRRLDCR